MQTLHNAELCESGLQLCQDFYLIFFWELASLPLQSETKQKVIREETQIHNLQPHARTHTHTTAETIAVHLRGADIRRTSSANRFMFAR